MSSRGIQAEEFAGSVVIKRKEDFATTVGKGFTETREKI